LGEIIVSLYLIDLIKTLSKGITIVIVRLLNNMEKKNTSRIGKGGILIIRNLIGNTI
jgi:hypothetical protein